MKKTVFMIMTVMAAVSCGGRGEKVPAIDITNFDTSVAPSEDFYRYATGGWQQKNPLKPEYSRFGSFDILNENNQKRLKRLADRGSHKYGLNSGIQLKEINAVLFHV